MQKNRLWRLGHDLRRQETKAVQVVENIYLEFKRESVILKNKWFEVIQSDIHITVVWEDDGREKRH